MPFIDYPNVPDVPGVPSIPRLPDSVIENVQQNDALAQAIVLRSFRVSANWGVFDADGNPLGDPNLFTEPDRNLLDITGLNTSVSTNSFEFSKSMKISSFPVEQGTFANYNKVELPAVPVVTLVYGGTESERSEFLRQIEVATDTTDLYSVVTPEVTYINFSVEKYDYSRTNSAGANLLVVRLTLSQIRQVSAQFTSSNAQLTDPKEPGAANEVDNGKVQTKAPDDATIKAAAKKLQGAV